ncbi:unnamed protein product [Amoebophrya sp. A120]|nr:unnamed protein product [Amoebophrya sp. A120]|eukprot:GSA120T00014947001.1
MYLVILTNASNADFGCNHKLAAAVTSTSATLIRSRRAKCIKVQLEPRYNRWSMEQSILMFHDIGGLDLLVLDDVHESKWWTTLPLFAFLLHGSFPASRRRAGINKIDDQHSFAKQSRWLSPVVFPPK